TLHPQRHHLENCSRNGGLPEGINRESIAKFLNVRPMAPNPSATATVNVWVGIDDVVGSGNYFHDSLSVGFGWKEKKLDVLLVARQAAQSVDEFGRKRFVGDIGSPICMAVRDGIVKFALLRIARDEIDARQELRRWLRGNWPQLAGNKCHASLIAIGGCGQQQILESATNSNVFFAQVGIERADVPSGVDIQLNRGVRYLENPGLSVVRTCGENSGADQGEGPVVGIAAPVLPGFVSRSFTDTEGTLLVGAPDSSANN